MSDRIIGTYKIYENYCIDVHRKMWEKIQIYMLGKCEVMLKYTHLERKKGRKKYYACIYKGKGAKSDFKNPLSQEMRKKGRTLNARGIRK